MEDSREATDAHYGEVQHRETRCEQAEETADCKDHKYVVDHVPYPRRVRMPQ